ncbi:gamma-glutamyltransferase family protein [Microbacterium sp. B2969]|uniref:Gamma-glutamyltransferase family protein n=1 Tax=Microbacterium alkaliflavum TaxID=3248839 RepID=A0ABW7Q688_9MICO
MAFTPPPAFTTRPTLEGTFGMSASTHWLATASAQAVLERGGNAFDAVVAGGFVLHVVEPHLNGPGGDLVGVFATADDPGRPVVLMGQGPAPAGATIEHFRGAGLDLVPGAGGLAAAVPGAVDAWLVLLRDHGTMELADVLSAAVHYARDGAPLLPQAVATIRRVEGLFREHWPSSSALWLPGGDVPEPGTLVPNPAYADVLDRLVAAGHSVRDDGPIGRAARIDAARDEWKRLVGAAASDFLAQPHRHSTGGDHAAVITREDVAAFDAGYDDAATAEFRGHVVAKAGAWTQGPALLEALRILDPLPDAELDPSTARGAHMIVETIKLVLADRDAHFGDGARLDRLLSDGFAAERRALLGPRASDQWRPGALAGVEPFHPPLHLDPDALPGAQEPTIARTGDTRGDTCHIDVVDRWGNIVAVTPSGGWLQSSPAIPELGFCLGTRLQMTWLDEAAPAALRPGARPRTTLTPTLVLRDGRAVMALGTPGGDQQEQWQLSALLRMLVGGYSAQQAIDAPALHTIALVDSFWPRTWHPDGVFVEDRIGDAVIAELAERGHAVVRAGDWSLGRLSAVGIDRDRGVLWAAANPRGIQGYATGR